MTETTNAKVMMESCIKVKQGGVVTAAEDVVDQTRKIIILMKIAMVCDGMRWYRKESRNKFKSII